MVSIGLMGQNNISGTINNYAEVTNINVTSCSTLVEVSSAGGFSAGDRVVMIQMKGASINTTNTSSYGSVVNYENAGNYEFADVTDVNGNTVVLRAPLSRNYMPVDFVQLIRVPTYNNATVTTNLSAPAWDGTTGGVLALEVSGNLTLNADMDMNGKGFRGGNNNPGNTSCGESDYAYTMASGNGGRKGEVIPMLRIEFSRVVAVVQATPMITQTSPYREVPEAESSSFVPIPLQVITTRYRQTEAIKPMLPQMMEVAGEEQEEPFCLM
ncbi:MAG: hypothetical protein BRD50_09200 [Bacteroidetes bacterium SW_11_45_7]|nr:MAG: hypothetical protein BRD50_09200 [Bacteroidetes bacterium SW_11_45_7]